MEQSFLCCGDLRWPWLSYLANQSMWTSLCALFSFFDLAMLFTEMGVEVTYPAAKATSSGLLWSAVQVMRMLLLSQLTVMVPHRITSGTARGTMEGSNNILGNLLQLTACLQAIDTTSIEDTIPKYWTSASIFMLVINVHQLCLSSL